MTTRLDEISKACWEQILAQKDKIIDDVKQMYASTTFTKEKSLKNQTHMRIGTIPTSKLHVIEGSRLIKGDLRKALAWDLRGQEITHDMKKDEREGFYCRHFYFDNADFEKYCREAIKSSEAVDVIEGHVLYHNVVEIPVVTNREMLILRILKKEGEGKYSVYSGSLDLDLQLPTSKTIRGYTRSINTYEKVDDDTFKCSVYIFADPCGSIPASFYNNALEDQMKFLQQVDDYIHTGKWKK